MNKFQTGGIVLNKEHKGEIRETGRASEMSSLTIFVAGESEPFTFYNVPDEAMASIPEVGQPCVVNGKISCRVAGKIGTDGKPQGMKKIGLRVTAVKAA